jgi:TorA maturation chaperone TorD
MNCSAWSGSSSCRVYLDSDFPVCSCKTKVVLFFYKFFAEVLSVDSKHQCASEGLSDLTLAEELTALKSYLQYGSLLFAYPTINSYEILKQAVSLFAEDHQAISGRALPVLPELPELQAVYTALFSANPGGLPAVPYASFHIGPDGQTYGEATTKLHSLMSSAGVAPADQAGEPADHISCILGFASLLAGLSCDTGEVRREFAELLDEYLLPWLPQFSTDITASGISDFYSSAADFCNNLMQRRQAWFPLTFNCQ